MTPENPTPNPEPPTYRSVLGKSLKRMRAIIAARDRCLSFVERVEGIATTNTEGRKRCIRELKGVAADFDKTLKVELNAADALIERGLAQAESAVTVVSVMTEQTQARLARVAAEVRALHRH